MEVHFEREVFLRLSLTSTQIFQVPTIKSMLLIAVSIITINTSV